jgi:hypothetical protein
MNGDLPSVPREIPVTVEERAAFFSRRYADYANAIVRRRVYPRPARLWRTLARPFPILGPAEVRFARELALGDLQSLLGRSTIGGHAVQVACERIEQLDGRHR